MMLAFLPLLSVAAADELPPGWQARPPAAQAWAATYRYHNFSSCSQGWATYTVDAAMTLTLAPDGTARGCRELRADSRDPDGQHITADLQSLSGTYTREGPWIALELVAGGDRCGEPRSTFHEQRPWKLRCTDAVPPAADGAFPADHPLLVCQFQEPTYTASLGMRLHQPLPGDQWIVFGAGDGVDVRQGDDDSLVSAQGMDERLRVTPRTAPPAIGERIEGLIFSE